MGLFNTGIANPEKLAIPGLGLRDFDTSVEIIKVAVPYGPVYVAMREIATTYEIGMQITLEVSHRYVICSRISKL